MPIGLLTDIGSSFGLTEAAVCVLWGVCATVFSIAFQSEVIRATDADTSSVAMSIFSGIFNLGIGSGTALGGVVVSGWGIGWVGAVGAVIAAASLACCLVALIRSLAVRDRGSGRARSRPRPATPGRGV